MRDIAEYIQVICISHLPQVASMSDHHLLISKASNDDRTTTQVKELENDDKIDEIARMISGASVTELTRENAKEMISQNQRKVVSNSLNLLISKASNDDRTTTQVKELENDDKIDEIARMISGASVTELTRENAKEMISQNQRKVVSNSLNLLIIIFAVK